MKCSIFGTRANLQVKHINYVRLMSYKHDSMTWQIASVIVVDRICNEYAFYLLQGKYNGIRATPSNTTIAIASVANDDICRNDQP